MIWERQAYHRPSAVSFWVGAPHGHEKTTFLVAGLSRTGIIATWVLDGAMNGEAFTHYVNLVLRR